MFPEILKENAQIEVLNGSQTEGKAGKAASRLRRLGFHVIDIDNYNTENDKPVFRTFIKNLKPGKNLKTIEVLQKLYDITDVREIPIEEVDESSLSDVQLILGVN